jgi:hypothetical protein
VTTEDPPTTPWFDRLRKESAALSALSAKSPSVLTRRKAAAAMSAAAAPGPAEPSIAELDSQSFDLDDIGPPSPPQIPAFRNGRKTFISRHEAENDDDDNESDDQDKSTTEGRPSKRSKSNQEENKSDNNSIEGDDVGGEDNVAEGDDIVHEDNVAEGDGVDGDDGQVAEGGDVVGGDGIGDLHPPALEPVLAHNNHQDDGGDHPPNVAPRGVAEADALVEAGESTSLSSSCTLTWCSDTIGANYACDSDVTISMNAWTANHHYRAFGKYYSGSHNNDFHPRLHGSICSSAISSKPDTADHSFHFTIPSSIVIPHRYCQNLCQGTRSLHEN